jgi:HK97 family phage major capsid protein
MNVKEMQEKRSKLLADARALLDRAEHEGRDLTPEESQQFDRMMQEADALAQAVERRAQLEQRDAVKIVSVAGESAEKPQDVEYRSAFLRYLRFDKPALSPEELRALGEGSGAQGGYLVPTSMAQQIVTKLHEANFIRRLATVIKTDSTTTIPVEDTVAAAAWTGESGAIPETTATFAQKQLGAYKLTCLFKVSEELLQDAAFDLEAYLAGRIAGAFADAEIAAFVNGDGSGKPAGIVGAAGVGVTAASATAIAADELISLFYALDQQYRQNAVWVMHPTTAAAVRKLKATTNEYLWQPGLAGGQPETLLGLPLYTTVAMPTIGAGKRSVLLANFGYYWVGDRGQRQMQRLSELYAANGQVGFRAWERVDGVLTLSDAAKVLVHP